MLRSVLIANRGEIACRITRTAQRMGLRVIAVYSEADRHALHVRMADTAICIGPANARESYLNVASLLAAARESGAEGIHPGYGFLSENTEFARACSAAALVFIGPPPSAIDKMGSKSAARQLMSQAGVPVLPGYDGADQSDAALTTAAVQVGFPLLVKPTAGGGGKGMRIVRAAAELLEALASARREAAKSFGDDRLLLERFVEVGRHVEIQIFADSHGNAVHLFERDCSLQRRHQKVIEEAPAPGLSDATRTAMGEAAVAAARAVAYEGAGTVEFLYDGSGFYFLEMNTRLQVEHPVTEMITGIDLVEWQLRVACGESLPLKQQEITRNGHAVEARLYAEDPARGFLPSTGTLSRLRFPAQLEHVRVDAGVEQGDSVTVHYDPMIAKIIAWAPDRGSAIDRLRVALEHTEVDGVRCNARFLWEVLGKDAVRSGAVNTRLLEQGKPGTAEESADAQRDAWLIAACARLVCAPGMAGADLAAGGRPWASGTGYRLNGPPARRVALRSGETAHWLSVESEDTAEAITLDGVRYRVALSEHSAERIAGRIDGRPFRASLAWEGETLHLRRQCLLHTFQPDTGAAPAGSASHEGQCRAPMPGHVLNLRVAENQLVAAGEVMVVLEAMKMEHALTAPWAGRVTAVKVQQGERVDEGADLVFLEPLVVEHETQSAAPD